jgi:hypothetical protein
MGYVQKNNPFQKTSCGRRRSFMTVGNSSPIKKNKLSKEVVKNYEDINIGKDVLDYLNVTPSDTVTVKPRGHKGIDPRINAAVSLAGKGGTVRLPRLSPDDKLTTSGEQGSKKERVAIIGDQTYTKDNKEELASSVAQKRKRKRKPDVRKTTKGKNRNFRTTKEGAGMTKKGVAAYRRKNPGSKLKTAVTGKVKRGSKAAKRRKSFCARSRGWTGPRGRAARRRWKC